MRRFPARRRFRFLWVLCALVLLPTGCKTIDMPQAPPPVSEKLQRRNQEAIHSFEASRAQTEYQAALNYQSRGDTGGCRKQLETLLEHYPDHREARLLLAELYRDVGLDGEAIAQFQQVLKRHPNDARAHYGMGTVLERTGQREGATSFYTRAAQLDPSRYAASALAPTTAGESAEGVTGAEGSSEDRGEVNFVGHLTHDEGPLPGEWLQAGAEALASGSAREAMSCFDEARALAPDDPHIPNAAAVLSLRANQPDLAATLLEDAMKRFPREASLYLTLGTAYYRLGDYAASQHVLGQALSLDKSSALSYFLMGCTLAKTGQSEAAEAHFRQAHRIDSRYPVRR